MTNIDIDRQIFSFRHSFLIKNGKLLELLEHVFTDEIYYKEVDGALVPYQEELDGPILTEKVAKELYPEEFI